jgi:hypothetical protein
MVNPVSKVELPTEIVKCEDPICSRINQIYQQAPPDYKQFLVNLTKQMRKNIRAPAEDIAIALGLGRSTLFYRLQRLGLKFDDLQKALLLEAEQEFKRKLERREIRRLPPRDKQEFLERETVKKMIQAITASGKKQRYINRVINSFYKLCRALTLSPEDFKELPREQIFDLITQYISDRASEGLDVNNVIKELQAIQKWLGVRILPPGVTQKEYKGKYQEAEIPPEIRNAVVSNLLELYESSKNPIFLKTIQAMALLYYTGSRKQALMNYQKGEFITVGLDKLVKAVGTNRFRVISTLEKKDIYWKKLIPAHYDEIIPPAPFRPSEVKAIGKILKEQLMKYYNQYNAHTQLYLARNKVFHIWRHTATREYLKALGYNRYLVAKLLGWIKDSNLVIYGDYELLRLLELSTEEHTIKFIDDALFNKVLMAVRRAGL